MNANMSKPQVIVSMTSFPAAISYAERAILSLLEGSVLPDKVVLYLTVSQFGENGVPQSLLELADRDPIFEVRNYDRDIRSYRKLIPALHDFPDAIIVTVDDDVAYHKHMLTKYRWYSFVLRKIHIGFKNIQTGVGGVLYPPHSLKSEMLDVDLFTQIAPTTDDIWFWAAAVANGTPIVPVPFGYNKPKGLEKPRELSLKTTNFKSGMDRNAAALKAIVEKYPEVGRRIGYDIKTNQSKNE